MGTLNVCEISEAEAERAVASLTLAFATDPVIRRFYPDPLDHQTHFSQMMRINLAPAIASRSAHCVEGMSAVAVWFRPAGAADEVDAERDRGRRTNALIAETARTEGNDDLFVALGEMEKHHPRVPHWYLMSIGVDPFRQGEGLGSLLMEHALPMSDADGTLAYLESSNPRNVPFYQRHGFDVIEVVQIGDSPTFTLMAREPRSSGS